MINRTKLIIIRHGQSMGNATNRILGHTDMDLTDLGYKQANATAEHLKNEKIVKIYSSDLKRAFNTAIPHGKLHNLDVFTSKDLRELYVGEWENLFVNEIIERWGREVYENQWFGNFGTFKFPSGEAVSEGGIRFYNELVRISKDNPGKTVLISAHAAVIRAFWGYISGISWSELADKLPFPTNASYSIAYFDGETIIPDKYSCDEHLVDVGITKVKMIN